MSKHTKRHRIHNVTKYFYIPLLYTVIGYSLIYMAGRPVVDMVSSVAGMVFTNSTPKFTSELDSIYNENSVKAVDYIQNKEVQLPEYETLYANLTCERVNLKAPVYFGDSDKVLKKGVGQYIGSFIPGNNKPVLIGGHDSTYFEPLESVKEGDTLVITTNYGIYNYKVTHMEIKSAADTSAYNLNQDKEELILYTCYPFGAVVGIKDQRYFVYADKASGPEIVYK